MNKVSYFIPKQNEGIIKDVETYAEEKVKELCNNIDLVRKNARLVIGCGFIEFENKFAILLDEAYRSFLIGHYYSTVSICSIGMERLWNDYLNRISIGME